MRRLPLTCLWVVLALELVASPAQAAGEPKDPCEGSAALEPSGRAAFLRETRRFFGPDLAAMARQSIARLCDSSDFFPSYQPVRLARTHIPGQGPRLFVAGHEVALPEGWQEGTDIPLTVPASGFVMMREDWSPTAGHDYLLALGKPFTLVLEPHGGPRLRDAPPGPRCLRLGPAPKGQDFLPTLPGLYTFEQRRGSIIGSFDPSYGGTGTAPQGCQAQ